MHKKKRARNQYCFANWNEKNKYWRKTVNNVRYQITCRQLGLPRDLWTKEASEPLARLHFKKTIPPITEFFATPESPQVKADKSVLEQLQELREVVNKLEAKIG